MTDIKIDVEGEDKLIEALEKYPRQSSKYLTQAGQEAAKRIILPTRGLKAYPPMTGANRPGRTKQVTFGNGHTATFRMGYYIRGRGMQVPVRGDGYRNLGNSERLGTQWKVTREGYGTKIANGSSYAQYVHGSEQARAMDEIGWRKLADVAIEKLGEIREVYQSWVDKLLRDLGL